MRIGTTFRHIVFNWKYRIIVFYFRFPFTRVVVRGDQSFNRFRGYAELLRDSGYSRIHYMTVKWGKRGDR